MNWKRWGITIASAILTFVVGVIGAYLNFNYKMNFPDLGSVFAIVLIGGIIVFILEK